MLKTTLTAVLALFYAVNALWMLAAPPHWYASVPGVTATGPLNLHFVRDIGFAYLLSAGAVVLALRRAKQRRQWLLVATAWPALHAIFHLAEWGLHGLPPAALMAAESGGVLLPVALGFALALAAPPTPSVH